MNQFTMNSPFGPITLSEHNGFLTGLIFSGTPTNNAPASPLLSETQQQLLEYFSGIRTEFSIPIKLSGTAFQETVWEALRQIPYGATCTYEEIAEAIERPSAVRAAAHAIGQNPISILVPCHRVIGKNGTLTGFAWGLDVKKGLLELENT